MKMRAEMRDALLARVAQVLDPVAKTSRVLEVIAWPRSVERAFFEQGASALPEPEYQVDRVVAEQNIASLEDLAHDLEGDHPLLAWLRAIAKSYVDANHMILAVGTSGFYALSRTTYGGARTTALDDNTTNLDFAEHVGQRVGAADGEVFDPTRAELTTDAFIDAMLSRLNRRNRKLDVDIVADEDLSAKVICGTTKMRVRAGATFTLADARGLFAHEIETHALTSQNGAAQPHVPFLRGGGPRTTRAQEGLAVFSELYGHALSTGRLRRLVERVRLVHMAEEGASFLDLFRYLCDRGAPEHDAYLDAQRICRGGLVAGRGPFTKDASYLSGLMDVYNFLRVVIDAGARRVAEVLVSGRIALEDLDALVWLRGEGVLSPPKYLPRWLSRWDSLVAYFSFTSFLNEVDLAPVVQRHRALLARIRASEHE